MQPEHNKYLYFPPGGKYKYLKNNFYILYYMKNSIFINLLKKHTNIDRDFINTFFKKFKIGAELDFDIKDIDVCKYLNIKLSTGL